MANEVGPVKVTFQTDLTQVAAQVAAFSQKTEFATQAVQQQVTGLAQTVIGSVSTVTGAVGQMNQELVGHLKESAKGQEQAAAATKKSSESVRASLKQTGEAFAKVAQQISGHVKAVTSSIDTLNAAAGAFAAGQSLRAMAEFDQALTAVRTVTKQTEAQFVSTRSAVLALAQDFKVSATVVASGLNDIVQAGFDGSKAFDVLKASIKAGQAGLTDTATASSALIQVMNAYRISSDQAENTAGKLVKAVDLGVFSFQKLAAGIGGVAPIAARAGVSLNELLSVITAGTRQEANLDEVITQVRSAITDLLAPSKELEGEFRRILGTSSAVALQTRGLTDTISTLSNAYGGNVEQLAKLFPNVRALNLVLKLAGEGAKDAQKDFAVLAGTGSAALDSAVQSNTSSLASLGRQLKAIAENSILQFFEDHRDAIIGVGKAIVNFADQHRTLLVAFTGVTLAIGALAAAGLALKLAFTGLTVVVAPLTIALKILRDVEAAEAFVRGAAGIVQFTNAMVGSIPVIGQMTKALAGLAVVQGATAATGAAGAAGGLAGVGAGLTGIAAAAGAAAAAVGILLAVLAAAVVVAEVFYRIGRGIRNLAQGEGPDFLGTEADKVQAEIETYRAVQLAQEETFNNRVGALRAQRVADAAAKAKQEAVIYKDLADAAKAAATGNLEAYRKMQALQKAIADNTGLKDSSAAVEAELLKVQNVIGSVLNTAGTLAGNQLSTVKVLRDELGNFKIDPKTQGAQLETVLRTIGTQLDSSDAGKELKEKLAATLSIGEGQSAKEAVVKLLAQYETLIEAKKNVAQATSDATAAERENISAMLVLTGATADAADALGRFAKTGQALVDQELTAVLEPEEQAMQALAKSASELTKQYNDLEAARVALEAAMAQAPVNTTQQTNQLAAIKAAQEAIAKAADANAQRQDKIVADGLKKQADAQLEADRQLEQLRADHLKATGEQDAAAEIEAKARYDREVERVKALKYITDQQRDQLLLAVRGQYEDERAQIATTAQKRYEASDEYKAILEQQKEAEKKAAQLREVEDLRQQLARARLVGDLKEEDRLRAKILTALEKAGEQQEANAQADRDSRLAVQDRLKSLYEELNLRDKLQGAKADRGGTARRAQRDLIGTDSVFDLREKARGTLGGETTTGGVEERVKAVLKTLEIEYGAAEEARLQARKKRDKEAEAAAVASQREIAEKYKILLQEKERALANLAKQAAQGGAGIPGTPGFVGPPAPGSLPGGNNFIPALNRGSPAPADATAAGGAGDPNSPNFIGPRLPGAEGGAAAGPAAGASPEDIRKGTTALKDGAQQLAATMDLLAQSLTENLTTVTDTFSTITAKLGEAVGMLNENTAAIDALQQETLLLAIEGRSAN